MNGMPWFKKTGEKIEWINRDRQTAAFVKFFWAAATPQERKSADFLTFIIQAGWCNVSDGDYSSTTREWRNDNLARYLHAAIDGIDSLTAAVAIHWPKISHNMLRSHLLHDTGITHYYRAFRPATYKFIRKYTSDLADIFQIVSSARMDPLGKIRSAMALADRLPQIGTPNGGKTSALNAITPALACLDPNNRFPIMNNQTEALLKSIGARQDAEGASALASLIGKNNVETNLELDVYSQWYANDFPVNDRRKSKRVKARIAKAREVGIKSEEDSVATTSKQRVRIRKTHNKLINKFRAVLLGKYKLEESRFDVLVRNWKLGRYLLIEAKTASDGPGGRFQIRQAIGQLFDYRKTAFGKTSEKIDLAVLVPERPSRDIVDLLKSLDIHALWFDGDALQGTTRL
jgi:hypothetical protein